MNPKVRLKGKPTVTHREDGTVLLSGEIEEISDVSQVVIEPIPPEEFIKTGRSRYLDKADYLAHRYRCTLGDLVDDGRSEEHTSELQSLMRISYAVFCLKKKITTPSRRDTHPSRNVHGDTHPKKL